MTCNDTGLLLSRADREGGHDVDHSVRQHSALHCFHHAGGDRRAFRRGEALCPFTSVVAYDIGAGDGGDEPLAVTARRWWRSSPDPSGVYYGHSMGALVAYEAAVTAQVLGGVGPRAVILGPRPGHVPDEVVSSGVRAPCPGSPVTSRACVGTNPRACGCGHQSTS